MKPIVAMTPLIAAVALAGCGKSAADKAQSKVCDARADISKQVDTLKGLTPSTATTDQITSSLKAIGNDLKKIAGAQGDLNDKRKNEVQQANQAFASQVKQIVSTVGTSTSVNDAKAKLTTAFQQLATTYQQTFAKVDCG